jgi:phosphoglycolate phosphatase-like HAD superfamily hydrolase
MKILLFDIDGTLLLSGGAGARAIDRAFFELYGVRGAFGSVVPDGKTDPIIFREIIANHRLAIVDEAASFSALESCYARHMADEMPRSESARLMPGAVPILERLASAQGVALGLLTGNFEVTARIKLDRFDLNRFFPFGAFASDSDDRTRLVPIAVRRAEEHLERAIDLGPQVVVVGDTPRDVECAIVHGATAVGVAASRYGADELQAAGAHHVIPTLEDTEEFMAAISLF